jgi:hypothetical protein
VIRFAFLARACLVVGLLFSTAAPVLASETSASREPEVRPLLAGGVSSFLSGLTNRTRVIQVCVVVMCLALFILLKKFTDDEPTRQATGASRRAGPGGDQPRRSLTPDS